MNRRLAHNKWFANEANRINLRKLLSEPTFRAACETLLFNSQPDSGTVFGHADSAIQQFAWLGGYNQFLRDLHQLADTPHQPPSFEGNEWNYQDNV